MPIDLVDQRRELHRLRIELELAGLDLGEVEHLVDEAEQVRAGAVHALQRLQRLLRAEARRVGDHHLGQPDDGVERRAQLVAHAGDELRLVLARLGELTVLVLDFVEQPHVLDRDHCLVGEGLYQLDLLVREWPHRLREDQTPIGTPSAASERRALCGYSQSLRFRNVYSGSASTSGT